jgi:alanine racemase
VAFRIETGGLSSVTKNRWSWAEIDLSAITDNVTNLKALTGKGTLFMAVVKADGYGHGAEKSARAALAGGADRLGVATVAEGLELRHAGISAPVMLLSEPPEASIPALLENDLMPTVTTREFAVALGKWASARGLEADYHLKVDSGMNRIGVRAEDAAQFALGLSDFPGLRLEGTFTHFATADVPGDWEVERQFERFRAALEEMRTEGVAPGIVHAANSPATVLYPETHLDMVRCGLSIYGMYPSPAARESVRLTPARSVKARATLVKRVGMGESVSYGFTWTAAAPTTVATLPIGYADGIHRAGSNKITVIAAGKRCRQIGRVCMDQLMIEVPRGVELARGDELVLVGEQAGERVTIEELAEASGTINYEITCALGMRLQRVYS